MDSVSDYTTITIHGDLKEKGVQKVMQQATIREERLLQIHVEILDPDYVKANQAEVQEGISAFILRACDTAMKNGVPVSPAEAKGPDWAMPGNIDD